MARGTHDNDHDNEPLSFITLAAATANVVRYLSKEQHPPQNDNRAANDESAQQSEKHPEADREYVEHRLRQIAAWERRISGKKD